MLKAPSKNAFTVILFEGYNENVKYEPLLKIGKGNIVG